MIHTFFSRDSYKFHTLLVPEGGQCMLIGAEPDSMAMDNDICSAVFADLHEVSSVHSAGLSVSVQ